MANITIVSVETKNYHKIIYGDYSSKLGFTDRIFWPDDIEFVDLDGMVVVSFKSGASPLIISFDGSNERMKVDTVLGITPTDNDHLATLIADLKG